MKKNFLKRNKPVQSDLQVGDKVRIKGPDGWFRDPEEITEVGKTSVTLGRYGKWPMTRVSRKKEFKMEVIRAEIKPKEVRHNEDSCVEPPVKKSFRMGGLRIVNTSPLGKETVEFSGSKIYKMGGLRISSQNP